MTADAPLGAVATAAAIRAGSLTAAQAMRACLDRIATREDKVRAFVHLDAEAAMARAEDSDRALQGSGAAGPFQGVPFAVKDIIDTDFAPTSWGTPIHAGHRPARNAACVALMIAAGAVPVGKTVTTEFAYFSPGPTANPAAPGHTPGGSSSGSAAAVADGMVPLAFGTQTAASIIRPAAFCGVLGYKGSHGDMPLEGVMGFAPSLDSLGLIAREAVDLVLARVVLAGGPVVPPPDFNKTPPRIALMRGPHWSDGRIAMREMVRNSIVRLTAAGATVSELATPLIFAELTEAHKTVMAFEAARTRAHEATRHTDSLSPVFAELMAKGQATPRAAYEAALATRDRAARLIAPMFLDCDVILTPAASGPPPKGIEATGDPLFSRGWTLLQLPAIAVPAGPGLQAVQLIGPKGGDDRLIAAAAWIVARLA